MKKDIERIEYKTRQDFFDNRLSGIGASEIAIALGTSEWDLAANLFLQKIGMRPIRTPHTAASAWGTELEDTVANMWRFYSPDDMRTEHHYITHYDAWSETYDPIHFQRKCRRINCAVRDKKKYPHLFVSIDRTINKGQFMLPNGDINPGEGILEVKTKNFMADKKWEGGVDPSNILQLQGQLMVSELNYGEIVAYDNMRNLTVISQTPNENIQSYIAEKTAEFWDLCLEGRKLYEQMMSEPRADLQETLRMQIYNMAPEPTKEQHKLGKDFYSAKYKRELEHEHIENIQGTDEHQLMADEYKYLKAMEKDIKNRVGLIQNQFRNLMGDQWYVDLPSGKKVSYKPDVNGKDRMTVSGAKPDTVMIEEKIDRVLGKDRDDD